MARPNYHSCHANYSRTWNCARHQNRAVSEASADALRGDILESFESLMRQVTRWRLVDLSDVDVTMPQARGLMLVALHPSISISTLASHLHIGLPAASGLVERLVEAGYVERNPDPHDRRHQLVTLSRDGRVLVERFHELPSEELGQLLTGLDIEELEGLRLGVAAMEREARRIAELTPSPTDPERTPA